MCVTKSTKRHYTPVTVGYRVRATSHHTSKLHISFVKHNLPLKLGAYREAAGWTVTLLYKLHHAEFCLKTVYLLFWCHYTKLLVLSDDIFCKKRSHSSSCPKSLRSLEEIQRDKKKLRRLSDKNVIKKNKIIESSIYQIKANWMCIECVIPNYFKVDIVLPLWNRSYFYDFFRYI